MPSNLTQEQLRAKWRVQRALQSSKEPVGSDVELLGEVEMEKIRVAVGKKATAQPAPSPSQPVQIPVQAESKLVVESQPPPQQQRQDHQEGATTAKAGRSAERKRPLSKTERAWADFYSYQFGPLVVLVLWVGMRDLEKASFYAPNPDEMRLLSPYMARGSNWIAEKLKIPEVAVDAIQNSGDYTDFCYIVLGYLHRIGVLDAFVPWVGEKFDQIREDVQSGRSAEKNGPASNEGVPAAGANGNAGGYDLSTIRGLGAQYAAD